MKKIFIIAILGLFMWACAPQRLADRSTSENLVLEEEEDQYELTIFDNEFQTWFTTNSRPISFYSESYYEAKNQIYVNAWNNLFQQTGGAGPFGNRINYEPHIDYNVELDYQLFWYFKYIESRYGAYYNFPV